MHNFIGRNLTTLIKVVAATTFGLVLALTWNDSFADDSASQFREFMQSNESDDEGNSSSLGEEDVESVLDSADEIVQGFVDAMLENNFDDESTDVRSICAKTFLEEEKKSFSKNTDVSILNLQ